MKNTHFYVCILLTIVVSGCKSIKTESPESQLEVVPKIIQETSYVHLPIEINLKPHYNEIEKSIPKTFQGDEQNCSGVSYSYTMNRMPISFSAKGNEVQFDVKCSYALNLNYCPSCVEVFGSEGCVIPRVYASCGVGQPLRKMEVGFTSQLGIKPNWSFSSKTNVRKVAAIDPCKVTFVNYDATEELIEEVTNSLKKLEPEIDKSIQDVDLKSSVEEAWQAIIQPIDLNGYGLLYLNPQKIALDDLFFKNDSALVNLNLALQPKISLSPLDTPAKKLPELSEYQKADGFDLFIDIEANYDSLNALVKKEVIGKTFTYNKKTIILTDFKIHSTRNERINFAVTIDGSKKGILYLEGTPKFDSKTQQISIPDLVFDIKTKNAILKSAKWIFNAKIEEKLRAAAVFDLKPQLEEMKMLIEQELNTELHPGVHLTGKLSKLEIDHIYPFTHQLFLRVKVRGKLGIKM